MSFLLSLNPCYNGIKMKGCRGKRHQRSLACLNPCYNGIKMKVTPIPEAKDYKSVLILVIME